MSNDQKVVVSCAPLGCLIWIGLFAVLTAFLKWVF